MNIFSRDTITYLIFNSFYFYVAYRFLGIFFDRSKVNRLLEVLFFIVIYIINSTFYILFNNPFINIASSVGGLFLITFIYRARISTAFIAVLSTYLLSMIWEIIPYVVLTSLNIMEVGLVKAINSICIFATVLIMERRFSFRFSQKLNWIHLLSILSISIGSIIIIVITYSSDMNHKSTLSIVTILLYMNILIFYLYDIANKYHENLIETKLLNRQNSSYMNQLNIIKSSQEDLKIIKHDMKNHMLTLQSIQEKEQNSNASNYIKSIFEFIDNNGIFLESGNDEIDSLLNYKIMEAKKENIKVNAKVNIPEKINIDSFDISVIIGNLMDNALEAARKCEVKKIDIEMEMERGILYITVKNLYGGTIPRKDKRFLTNKADQQYHGIGLMSVEKSVLKYDGVMDIDINDGLFTVEVILYNDKIK